MDNTFTDNRGTIKDLLVTPDYSITHITFNEGAVRGNHYHNETRQIDVLLKGKLLCSRNGNEFISTMEGEQIIHNPKDSHAYKALDYSEILSICWGVRKGADYEKDVVRLETPLL
jgi:quercetin dioxygenase-like cupin family protein